jgi:ribonuclease D
VGDPARRLSTLDPGTPDFTASLAELEAAPRIAIDTEADPFHRYYEKVCLIQLSTLDADWFFDPLAQDGVADPIRALLSDGRRTLVLHGGDFDVRSLKMSFGLPLGPLVDTSIAAQLLGLPAIGLKSLLESQLGIIIDKTEQRSDWGKRPLSASQLEYARTDTQHLLLLAEKLEAQLAALGRQAWLAEECAILRTKEPAVKVFDPEGYRKIKGTKALTPRGYSILRALYVWREKEAQGQDRPPFRILRNEVLVDLASAAQEGPGIGLRDLKSFRGVPKSIEHRGLGLALLEGMSGEAPAPVPAKRPPAPPPEAQKRLERLRAGRIMWAQQHGLDPGILISGHLLERIALQPPGDLPQLLEIPGMSRWRAELIGPQILAAVAL